MESIYQKYTIILIVVVFIAGTSIYVLTKNNSTTLTPAGQTKNLEYINANYGFKFSLPQSWNGYSIVSDIWKGYSVSDIQGQVQTEQGPEISIRNPKWTKESPTQDIPIMIFTLEQWDNLTLDKYHIGAAPIGPSELGRNNRYVFALPARYNFAYPEGYKEVETILENKPLTTFSLTSCIDEPQVTGTPFITSISPTEGGVGTNIKITGCNLIGFEGDKNVWIENSAGIKGIVYGKRDSNTKQIEITLPKSACQKDNSYSGASCEEFIELSSGKYMLYTNPWGKKSNKVDFLIK